MFIADHKSNTKENLERLHLAFYKKPFVGKCVGCHHGVENHDHWCTRATNSVINPSPLSEAIHRSLSLNEPAFIKKDELEGQLERVKEANSKLIESAISRGVITEEEANHLRSMDPAKLAVMIKDADETIRKQMGAEAVSELTGVL